ncbi:MAG: protein translocase subunit SecD [Candidatus Pacebacteria bacterium]|nr:protein translocase subunit SecD [Candidatus Paceibacterota bacterium]
MKRILAILILLAGAGLGFFIYKTEVNDSRFNFRLGLDLAGGTLLTYRADVSGITDGDVDGAMSSLREVIERRVNVFGVSEPIVQTERASIASGKEERLIVELPGVTDVDAAVKALGETPLLEFKLEDPLALGQATTTYSATGLTGRYLQNAQLQFGGAGAGSIIQEPIIALTFDDEGTKLFADITTTHTGEILAIFLDGQVISDPVIQTAITDGKAIITGTRDVTEAKKLVQNLNFGALPVPVELVGAESIGASLGAEVVEAGVMAGLWGLIIVALFMILWYRLPGFIATLGLAIYALLLLSLFKLIPVTLTASGIAGFILTVGMAVDANILIFERMKEELAAGKNIQDALKEGFARAWLSIRDGNFTTILTAIILFYTTTSLVKGFALTLVLGVVISMFTALIVTRALLVALAPKTMTPTSRFLFGSGLSK